MPPVVTGGGSAARVAPIAGARDGRDRRVGGRGRTRWAWDRIEWALAVVAGLALAMFMFWPIVRHPASRIPADVGDPTLQAWQIAWAGHILGHDPGRLWHANAFYPEQYSYVFSDTLLGYAPAGLIGAGPVAAVARYNAMFVLAFALAFIGAYALARQLGGGRLAAAVAGCGFAYAPWHWNQAGHLHVLSTGGIALSLAMLARGHGLTLRRKGFPGRHRPGWALAGWLTAAWQITLGFGIGLPFGYVLAGLACGGLLWVLRRRPAIPRRLVIADVVGAVVFVLVTGAMAYPYLRMIAQHPYARRSLHDLEFTSPPFVGLFTAPGRSVLWGGDVMVSTRLAMSAPVEQTLLPGFTLYALAAVGLVVSAWSLRARLWLLAGTVLSAYLSLGLNVPLGNRIGYVLLFRYLPGWDAIRTPGRLTIWTTLLVAVLAAGAVTELTRRVSRRDHTVRPRRRIVMAGLLTLLLAAVFGEGLHRLNFPVVPPAPAALDTAEGPLVILPTAQVIDENVMLWSTAGWPQIVNGGSGFTPRLQGQLRTELKAFPDAHSVQLLRDLGVRTVIALKTDPVEPDNRDYARAADPAVDIAGLGLERIDDGETVSYTLTGR